MTGLRAQTRRIVVVIAVAIAVTLAAAGVRERAPTRSITFASLTP